MTKKIKIVKLTKEEDEASALNEKDFMEFLLAKTYEEQLVILLTHSQKNNNFIAQRRKKMENYNEGYVVSQEEIAQQFEEFCHTKGIVAKFKVAFLQMGENTRKQHELDKANIDAVKNSQENKEFSEFLHTKGLKAKYRLVIENIKKGAARANEDTAKRIDELNARTRAHINSQTRGNNVKTMEYSIEQLSAEFNAFLKEKGLDDKYSIQIVEE